MAKNKNVLVIDDSETTLVMLDWFLHENGFTAHFASTVAEALQHINAQIPDLILLDLNMPEVSGYDFLKMIKSEENKKNIPVLVISALDSSESKLKVKNMGAIDFIAKPLVLKELLLKINEIIK
jgi:DNA-binding response OmpR family regulator